MNNDQSYKVTNQTKTTLDRTIAIIESRKEMYNEALVAFALEKDEDGTHKFCYGLVTYLPSTSDKPNQFHYEYEKLVIVKQTMSIEDSINLLRMMYLNSRMELEGLNPINFYGTLHRLEYSESRFRYRFATTDWPSMIVSGGIDNKCQGILTQDSLVSLVYPLFPNGIEALRATLDLQFTDDAYGINPQIEIVIPDYRGKIMGLVIDGKHVTLDVLIGSGKREEMAVKFFSRGQTKTQLSENLPVAGNQIVLELDEEPLVIEVNLLSSIDGSLIDRISYDYRYSRTKVGVTLKDEQVLLLELISRGENQTVEFKKEFDKNRPLEVIESVVSFANTIGGRILLGVSDNGEIVGIVDTNVGERVKSWITEFCDPPIEVEYRVAYLQERNIGIIDVPEGENKPYLLKDKGPYVRRGSTDRSAKRSELDEFYQKKRSKALF